MMASREREHAAPPSSSPEDNSARRTADPEPHPPGERVPTSYRMIFEPRKDKPPEPASPARLFDPSAPTIARDRLDEPASGTAASLQATLGGYAPGDVLAQRYRLVELIGRGGMGAVWRARSLSLELDVALKLIRRDADVQHAAERLLKEARAAARVAHPSAVRVFDYGVTQAGDPFLVMELLHGTSLSQRLAQIHTFPALEAVQLVLPVAGALAAAHREGVVHRDVKPANVMLVEQASYVVPKLIDFGVAGVSAAIWEKRLTNHGMMLGSPVYMAPEQVRGGADPDERTDVWGVCTVLYELVSGTRPFAGPNSATVIFDILNAKLRRPEQFAEHPELWAVVERGLAKEPSSRWPAMGSLGRALAEWALARGAIFDAAGSSLAVHWMGELAIQGPSARRSPS